MSFLKYCQIFWGLILTNLLIFLVFLTCILYVEDYGCKFCLVFFVCLTTFLVVNFLIFILLSKLVNDKKKNKKDINKFNKEIEKCFSKIEKSHNLAEAGQISLGVYHDLSNILTSSNLALHQMTEKFSNNKELNNIITKIFKINHRANLLIKSFKNQCKTSKYKIKFNLLNEIKKNLLILEYAFIKNNIKTELIIDKDVDIFGDPIKFGQVLINLLNNAIESFAIEQKNRKILISVQKIISKEKNNSHQIELVVEDSGRGIPADILKDIFKPFFSSKDNVNSGHCGVGLAIIKKIVEVDFNGKVLVSSSVGFGTKFKIILFDFRA